MTTLFSVATRIDNHGCAVLTVVGEVDMATAPQLRAACVAALEGGANGLVLDMSGVSFLDASGLGALVGVFQRARAAGASVTLAAVQPRAHAAFELTNLTHLLGVCNVGDAIA
jgi:anti-sigma B factor antagonist